MGPLVGLDVAHGGTSLVAEPTLVGFFPPMETLVLFQARRVGEYSQALYALIFLSTNSTDDFLGCCHQRRGTVRYHSGRGNGDIGVVGDAAGAAAVSGVIPAMGGDKGIQKGLLAVELGLGFVRVIATLWKCGEWRQMPMRIPKAHIIKLLMCNK